MDKLDRTKTEMKNFEKQLKLAVKNKDLNKYLELVESPKENSIVRDDHILKFDAMVKESEGHFKNMEGMDDPNAYLMYIIEGAFKIATKWNLDKKLASDLLLSKV